MTSYSDEELRRMTATLASESTPQVVSSGALLGLVREIQRARAAETFAQAQAQIIAADVREACAKLAETTEVQTAFGNGQAARDIAARIRASVPFDKRPVHQVPVEALPKA